LSMKLYFYFFLTVFVKNARITLNLLKKNRKDLNFFSNYLLKSTLYDLCGIFEKKSGQSR